MSRRFAGCLSTLGLSLLLSLLGACAIEGPPDGFFDEGEGGYSAGGEGGQGGASVVGDPTSTTGIIEENRDDWDDEEEDDPGDSDFADGASEADPLSS